MASPNPSDIFYTASAISTGDGRNGHVRTSDGLVDTDLATPPADGSTPKATNPEELFASGYAACFHSALKAVAGKTGATLQDSSVTAEVSLGKLGDGFALAVRLLVEIGGLDEAKARELVDAAHQVCPYSNATRGNIDVTIDVQTA